MISAQCFNCTRFLGVNDEGAPYCAAFPDGIPRQILTGEADHRDPFPGDGGIRFDEFYSEPAANGGEG